MQTEEELFNRRRFLQWTAAAGVITLGTEKLLQGQEQDKSAGTRQPPSGPIVLRSSDLEIILDPQHGLPYEFHLLQNGSRMRGEDFGLPIKALVCRKQPWDFATTELTAQSNNVNKTSAAFHFLAKHGGADAASFTLHYELKMQL